jgi:flagellar biogenesis protein FliO
MDITRNFRIAVLGAALFLPLSAAVSAADADAMVLQHDSDNNKLGFSDLHGGGKALTAEDASSSSASLKVVGFWLLLLGAAAGAVILFYKRRPAFRGAQKGKQLAVLERLSVGPQRELMLLKACDRLLVVGCQGNQITLLSDLPAEESPSQPFNSVLAQQPTPTPTPEEHAGAWAGLVEKLRPQHREQVRTPAAVSAAYDWPDEEKV